MHSRARLLLIPVIPALALAAVGCGNSKTTTTTKPSSTPPAAASTASTSASATPSAGAGLSGTWSGHYSGAFAGTFTINWTQSGSNLSGKITLSNPPETTGITGALNGSTIKFGTVSGAEYNGTVSGNSMSGSYVTARGGGSWSATKG